jgi:hypothetical protein
MLIFYSNQIFIWWCLFAVFGALTILILLPFHGDANITGKVAFENICMLVGPVPTGLIVIALMHCALRGLMIWHTFEGSALLKYKLKKPTTGIVVSKETLPQPDGTAAPVAPQNDWFKAHRKKIIWFFALLLAIIWFFTH